MMEGIGGTRQEESHRVRQEVGGRRTVAAEVILHRLDIIFAIAPCAIEVFIELTFRTLFRSSEAILSEPPEEKGGQARPRLFHML